MADDTLCQVFLVTWFNFSIRKINYHAGWSPPPHAATTSLGMGATPDILSHSVISFHPLKCPINFKKGLRFTGSGGKGKKITSRQGKQIIKIFCQNTGSLLAYSLILSIKNIAIYFILGTEHVCLVSFAYET